jgi:hypothetical protein
MREAADTREAVLSTLVNTNDEIDFETSNDGVTVGVKKLLSRL